MPAFSKSSAAKLETCERALQELFEAVVKKVDCTIDTGHRTQEEQEKAFAVGNSDKHWPDGKHNTFPSLAVDVVPYAPDLDIWNVKDPAVQIRWWTLVYCILSIANTLNIPIRWGMDWNMDGDIADTKLRDWPHWELIR